MLAAATRIAHYEIIALLGAGGMGEVYRARDLRLRREVALKILPPNVVSNPERVQRFEQEAMAAGLLNHPNILTVFDIGSHDGIPFIVSELLDGFPLRDHLRNPLPLKKAVEYALQIASGLATAHEKGIVHRDLKPENVFVLTDGRVKVLDFGLAKLTQPDALDPEATANRHLTNPGAVVGTAGYMSPEQVRGEAVDQRSDIFSLGVMVYEMVSGTPPFRRNSSVETMNAILHDEPPALTEIPPGLGRILQHAVEKNPASRFQTAKDFGFALETVSGSNDTHPSVTARKRAPRKTEPTHSMASYRRVTFRRGFIMSARFAPDGSIVYGAAWEDNPLEVFSAYTTGPESRPLGFRDADVLSISRQGELALSLGRRYMGVGFATRGTLARVPLAGGAPRRVCDDVQEAEWTSDGKNFLIIRRVEGLYRIESPIGHVIYQTPTWVSRARFSPKEDLIAFAEHPVWGDDAGAVVIIDRHGKQKARSEEMWNSISGLAWTPNGSEVWFSGEGKGMVSGRDVVGMTPTGRTQERPVLPIPGRSTLHDIHTDGRLLLAIENGRREAVAGRLGESKERNLSWFDWSRLSGISNDGSFVAFEEQAQGVQGQNTVFIRTIDGAPAIRLAEGRARGNPISPDGQWVAIAVGHPIHLELVPTGAGDPRVVPCDLVEFYGWQFYPDGRRLLVLGNRPGDPKQLFEVPVDGDGASRPLTTAPLGGSFALSHDGKVVAAASNGRIVLFPTDGGEPRPVPGAAPAEEPLQWTTGNDAIFVSSREQASMKIFKVNITSGERHEWLSIHPDDPAGILDIMPVHITPDGQTYAYGYRRLLSDLYVVSGLL